MFYSACRFWHKYDSTAVLLWMCSPACVTLLALLWNTATTEDSFSKHVQVWCYSLEAKRICCDPNRLPPPHPPKGYPALSALLPSLLPGAKQGSVSHGRGSGSRQGMLVRRERSSPQSSPSCPRLIAVSILHQSVSESVLAGVAVWVKQRNHTMRCLLFIDPQPNSCSEALLCNWFAILHCCVCFVGACGTTD